MIAEQACEYGMECAHPQPVGNPCPYKFLYAFTHFACSFVCERKCHDSVWFVTIGKEVHDFVCKHPGFARSGTGYHQLRPVEVFHSLALLRV